MQDKNKIHPAEEKLAQTCGTTLALWNKLQSFYNIATNGLTSGVDIQIKKVSADLKYFNETGELAKYLYDPNDTSILQVLESTGIRQKTSESNQNIIDAACIVFAHGILESCVQEYLTITAMAIPEKWECYINRKKVEIGTLKEETYENICNEKIEKLLNSEVKRESLIDKLDRLHRIAPPNEEVKLIKTSYDRERLVKFDKARQEIVHGNDWSSYLFDFAKELDYWSGLNFYFVGLICVNTDLQLATKIMGHYWFHPAI